MTELTAGESYTRETLPDEIVMRLVRRADAEQNRHVNLARIADGFDRIAEGFERVNRNLAMLNGYLWRIADAIAPEDEPQEPEQEPEQERNEAGMPVPPWVNEESSVTETPPGAWEQYRKAAEEWDRPRDS